MVHSSRAEGTVHLLICMKFFTENWKRETFSFSLEVAMASVYLNENSKTEMNLIGTKTSDQ